MSGQAPAGPQALPQPVNLHGVAIAAGDLGLLVLGESRAGKSLLAGRMLAGWPHGAVRLVADDRVVVSRAGGRLIARPHPAIAGMLELRSYGIVRPPALDAVVLRAALRLLPGGGERLPEPGARLHLAGADLQGFALPVIDLPAGPEAFDRLHTIWPYLRDIIIAA